MPVNPWFLSKEPRKQILQYFWLFPQEKEMLHGAGISFQQNWEIYPPTMHMLYYQETLIPMTLKELMRETWNRSSSRNKKGFFKLNVISCQRKGGSQEEHLGKQEEREPMAARGNNPRMRMRMRMRWPGWGLASRGGGGAWRRRRRPRWPAARPPPRRPSRSRPPPPPLRHCRGRTRQEARRSSWRSPASDGKTGKRRNFFFLALSTLKWKTGRRKGYASYIVRRASRFVLAFLPFLFFFFFLKWYYSA